MINIAYELKDEEIGFYLGEKILIEEGDGCAEMLAYKVKYRGTAEPKLKKSNKFARLKDEI